ncbi:hypothetical protein I79_005074 [Cricetulus griseus]|uniref:Uncharacterized protein n=1 Tax=Cricetulus griseus TaxID=10029 RepID=G3H474_CRIGR|nr:hypothetical protein I79_005074 [Cricetulus griseus]
MISPPISTLLLSWKWTLLPLGSGAVSQSLHTPWASTAEDGQYQWGPWSGPSA